MPWTCLLFWPGLCYTHCHGTYRQLLLEMGTLTLRSRDVCWKTRQTSNRLDLATRAPAVFQCVGLEDAGTDVCVFFVNLNIRSNRIIRSNMKQVVLLRVEAFKGQYSILRGIWQIKTRFLGSNWVSKMRPCMQAVNQSTEVNTVGSRHHLIRNLGETERHIEVSYSSVAHKWMASFHLSWIDDFGGGNIISDQKEELLCSAPRFEPSKVGLCVRSWWHSTADRNPIRPIKPLCRISIIPSRVFSPVHDDILTIRFGWESLDQFPQQPWHHGRPDLGRKGRWEGQQGQDAKIKCMEDWCSEHADACPESECLRCPCAAFFSQSPNGSEKTSIAPTPLLASRRCTFECSSETEESPGRQCLEISMGLGLEFVWAFDFNVGVGGGWWV